MTYQQAKLIMMHGLFSSTSNDVYKNQNEEIVREIRENNIKIWVTDCNPYGGDVWGDMRLSISENGGANWLIVCTSDKRTDWKTNFSTIIAALTDK